MPAVFDDYLKKIISLEVVSEDADPTHGAPDDAS